MAFNQEELGIIEYAKTNGKTRQETEQALLKYRDTKAQTPTAPEPVQNNIAQGAFVNLIGRPAVRASEVVARGIGTLSGSKELQQNIEAKTKQPVKLPLGLGTVEPQQALGEGGAKQIAGAGLETASYVAPYGKIAKGATKGLGKLLPKAPITTKLAGGSAAGATGTYGFETGQKLQEGKTVPEAITPGATTAVGALLPPVLEGGIKAAIPVIRKAGDIIGATKTTLFGKARPASNIDDVIRQADESIKSDFIANQPAKEGMKPSQILKETEEATAQPNILQRWAGISPSIKNRIAGKPEKLKEYFDVAHARNNFDTLPTPLEHGAKNVNAAVSKMEGILNETGSDIGSFRQKIGTYKAPIESVNKIESSFNNELSKLNLEIKGGVIKQKAGTISRVNSENEIKVLNDLLGELKTIKQSPNLQRLIDFRNLFDSKINFAKSAGEASTSLDPFSRNMRKEIANVSAQIVGKSEASNLAKYSDFMDTLSQLKSFTDRKAGAEFLLKQVLSERGRVPRATMQLIKDRTGIDLMDDAVMASIATDLIGGAEQKGVFRQEITKAGLDASAILRGDTRGAIDVMTNFLKKGLVNEEKQFLKAASENPLGTLVEKTKTPMTQNGNASMGSIVPTKKTPIPGKQGGYIKNPLAPKKNLGSLVPDQPLLSEARKYKTAEEFVKAQKGDIVSQHKLIRNAGDLESIQKNGFSKSSFPNTMTAYRGGKPSNIIEQKYAPKKGDTILLIPKDQIIVGPNGNSVREGFKPTEAQIVKIKYDNQSVFEAQNQKLTSIWEKAVTK